MDHLAIHLMLFNLHIRNTNKCGVIRSYSLSLPTQENDPFCLAATIKLIYFPMAWFLIRAFIRILTVLSLIGHLSLK